MLKKVLVTGGAGFVGSHLCKRLVEEENYVLCLDNFFTGSRDNVAELLDNPKFKIVTHDVVNPFHTDVDEIYNLACPASPIHYQYDPIKTTKTSVLGILNMLQLAQDNHAKIMQASTSEVYGDPTQNPQKETYWGNVNPIGTRSCYDEGKRVAETFCMDYFMQYKIRVKIIRIFNTYGPNMDMNDGRVISNFIVQALKDEDITIYGDGSQTRSFQYVDNLIEGMISVMATPDSFIGPINLGNPNEFTILQLAQKVIEMTNSKAKIVMKPLPQDDPKQRKPDITLAKKIINYNPNILLEEGLKKTIAYFEMLLSKKAIIKRI
ncbi:MAG: SDR family oxidoreductase [Bacteroidales bacterium]|nr:SDR family oxidoreductase [Bacteroidales bacterium]MDD3911113.1 SDR family oxidoreductase [Bacteroidales bacterium]MDD4420024.1 SDR family oxidoreductase [Bacteroidales bacterium]